MTKDEAIAELRAYRATIKGRDGLVICAHEAGVNIRQIGIESGVARNTVYDILRRAGLLDGWATDISPRRRGLAETPKTPPA